MRWGPLFFDRMSDFSDFVVDSRIFPTMMIPIEATAHAKQRGNEMTATPYEVWAVAAVVYDQDTHNEADMNFLYAVNAADKEWADQLNAANINFGAGSEAWQAVKRLATRTREQALARALAEFEASDFPEFLVAAE